MDFIEHYIVAKINFSTLTILFCLMVVVAGFEKIGYLDHLARWIVKKAGNARKLALLLVLFCFFVSMLVTNDVALILFVPFTISLLHEGMKDRTMVFVLVLETIAANLGSMVTPIGNPQNLYLYQHYHMGLGEFVRTIGPYTLLSLLLLVAVVCLYRRNQPNFLPNKSLKVDDPYENFASIKPRKKAAQTIIYGVLFLVSLSAIFSVLHYWICFGVVVVCVAIVDRELFRKVNYSLLGKFIILFLVVGNVAEIPWIYKNLTTLIGGHEFVAGVAFSQVMSNVPAAIMLSSFTEHGTDLMLGVDIGGLGTLIASMASVITFEYYGKVRKANRKRYILSFSMWNIVFLAGMMLLWLALTFL